MDERCLRDVAARPCSTSARGALMPTRPIETRLSPLNRSVQRALLIFRAFRPGIGRLGNAELAERTGLARSTVSRLTQTLVESGFLYYDMESASYRLAAVVLSLAHAFRLDSDVLDHALPIMRKMAEDHCINVGLAVADRTDMVYLESVRRNRRELSRHVASGSRVPIELTSLGRAYLFTLSATDRAALEISMQERHPDDWTKILAEINRSLAEIDREGYCSVSWQMGITSIASPLGLKHLPPYVFNISYATDEYSQREVRSSLKPLLLDLVGSAREAFAFVDPSA